MDLLSDECLLIAYKEAKKFNLDIDFIKMIESEIIARNLEDKLINEYADIITRY